MKILLCIVMGFVLLGLLAYVVMAVKSQVMPERLVAGKGLERGQLLPCPVSPNCVCSEQYTAQDEVHFIAPIQGDKHTFERVKALLIEQGGALQREEEHYVYATFSTAIFHYVDDVELRFDAEHQQIHLRSASRIGRSDFSVNRKRILKLKAAL